MFRTFTVLFAVALLAGAVVASAAPDLDFEGEVVSVIPEKLILLAGAQQQEFVLTAATKITLNGKEVPVTELMAKQTAKVVAVRKEAKLQAVRITAFSPQ